LSTEPEYRHDDAPSDWTCGLALVAHPDDLEFGAAGAIAKWTSQGRRITYCMVTRGEAGIDSMPPEEAAVVRTREQIVSAGLVGVNDVEFLDFPDGVLEYGLPLRRALSRVIRRTRPEMIITNNYREVWETGELNQADHMVTGRALLDGVRDAANRWVFPDLLAEGLEPWAGARWLLAAHSPLSTVGVDVTDHIETALASLAAHKDYLAGLGDFDALHYLRMLAADTGRKFGMAYAVEFEKVALTS
jgi:LmbE family N-acetylglucosaminyl deacetylase